jgi:hypothetical protein
MDAKERERQVQEHLAAIRRLESTRVEDEPAASWPPDGYYLLFHVVVGITLGGVGALVSLLANVAGAPLFDEPALQLIRVYLTFPMGEAALVAEPGLVLFLGCSLYLATGALYGVAFHLLFSLYFNDASAGRKWAVGTALGLGLWVFNFYLVLSWLQPALQGDNWIVRMVPPWVGALTHLAFAWTMVVGELWGRFEPYRSSK